MRILKSFFKLFKKYFSSIWGGITNFESQGSFLILCAVSGPITMVDSIPIFKSVTTLPLPNATVKYITMHKR